MAMIAPPLHNVALPSQRAHVRIIPETSFHIYSLISYSARELKTCAGCLVCDL